MARAAPNPNDPPEIAKVKEAVKAALEAGELDRADELLAQLEKLEDAAIASRQLERAGASAQRGRLAMSELRYRDAARHFAEAARHVPTDRTDIRLGYLDQEAEALYRQGDERGDNGALQEAIERYRALLSQRPRDRVPLAWARTEMNLGSALVRLGERESGTAHLEAAVAADNEALKEMTRDRVPLAWASTEMNLGNALFRLGERESGTAHLEAAVAAYNEALKEYTRDRVPLDWARTEMNLGSALRTLGERESGTAHLEAAVAAYNEALKEDTRDRVPLDWAMSTGNQGVVLMLIAGRTGNVTKAQSAVQQIEIAFVTMRDGGNAPAAAYYEERLPKARSLFNRLSHHSQ